MAIIILPDRDRQAIVSLISLAPEKRDHVLEALSTIEPGLAIDAIAEQVASVVKISKAEAGDIVRVATNVIATSEGYRESIVNIVNILLDAFEEVDDDSAVKSYDRDMVREFIISAASNENISIGAKARRIMIQHNHVYENSQIFSDMRSVFAPSESIGPPAASVIIHNLKISYRRNGDRKSYYAALDLDDLLELQSVVERAIEKHKSISDWIETTGLNFIDP